MESESGPDAAGNHHCIYVICDVDSQCHAVHVPSICDDIKGYRIGKENRSGSGYPPGFAAGGTCPLDTEDHIVFDHVTYSYEGAAPNVKDITFSLKKGENLGHHWSHRIRRKQH